MFTLEIRTGNAAFQNAEQDDDSDDTRNEEIARILEHVAKRLRQGVPGGKCMDVNGNSVGSFGFGED